MCPNTHQSGENCLLYWIINIFTIVDLYPYKSTIKPNNGVTVPVINHIKVTIFQANPSAPSISFNQNVVKNSAAKSTNTKIEIEMKP